MNALRRTRSTAAALGGVLVAGLLTPWAAPTQAAAEPASFTCRVPMFNSDMAYPTTADITAQRVSSGAVKLTMKLGAMPGLAPVPIPEAPTSLKVTASVDGKPVTLSGSHTLKNLAPNAPIPMPVVTGTASSTASSVTVTVTKLDAVADAGFAVAVNCTPTSTMTRTVAVTGSAPAPRPQAKVTSTTAVKSTVSKKKVATVKATVRGSKGTATGKVTITVKKGKKVVRKRSVMLTKGTASLKTKKLKKGGFAVTVVYGGSAKYKASSRKSTFRVR